MAGKYELLRLLGLGGMGVVYAARHQYTGKQVALKLLNSDRTEPRHAQRFLREARAASAIGHPSIVDVYDAGEGADGAPYLVMELLEGEDLRATISRGPIEPDLLARIAAEILDGLAAAHERGIVHRDIKPDNVFLVDRGGEVRAKLLDFGVAKLLPSGADGSIDVGMTMDGAVMGTPYYMSPEQVRGESVDARSDLWSVGAVLYHAVAGRPPFQEPNYNKLIVRILSEEPPSLRGLAPAWLAAVVDRAMVPDRSARWQTAAAMARALRARDANLAGPEVAAALEITTSGMRPRARAAPLVRILDENSSTTERLSGDDVLGATIADASPPAAMVADAARRGPSPWLVGAGVLAIVIAGGIVGVLWDAGESPREVSPVAAPAPPPAPVVEEPIAPAPPPAPEIATPAPEAAVVTPPVAPEVEPAAPPAKRRLGKRPPRTAAEASSQQVPGRRGLQPIVEYE